MRLSTVNMCSSVLLCHLVPKGLVFLRHAKDFNRIAMKSYETASRGLSALGPPLPACYAA